MVQSISSCMDKSSCSEVLMFAENSGYSQLKRKALQCVEKEFVLLCESHALGAIDTKTMEEVARHPTFRVRSELDVLRAIVTWLDATTEEGDITEAERAVTGEKPAKRLFIDKVGVDDLREVGNLAGKSGLGAVVTRCSQNFFKLKDATRSLLLSTPIPVDRRFACEKHRLMFSISHRFQFAEKSNAQWRIQDVFKSPWMPGIEPSHKWQLNVIIPRDEKPVILEMMKLHFAPLCNSFCIPARRQDYILRLKKLYALRVDVGFALDSSHSTNYSGSSCAMFRC